MRATIIPTELHVRHADPDDDTWTHTASFEDEEGSEVSVLLSGDMFQQLWAACEKPDVVEPE